MADSRLVVWSAAVAFASGLPLMFLPSSVSAVVVGPLQAVHAASALVLVLGGIVHMVVKLVQQDGGRRARASGAWSLVALSVASVSGALSVRNSEADRLLEAMGLTGAAVGAKNVAAVIHFVYASTLVLLTIYWHLRRLGRPRAIGSWPQATLALGICVGTAAIAGGSLAADVVRPATTALAPPIPGLWAWTMIVAVLALLLGGRSGPPSAETPSLVAED